MVELYSEVTIRYDPTWQAGADLRDGSAPIAAMPSAPAHVAVSDVASQTAAGVAGVVRAQQAVLGAAPPPSAVAFVVGRGHASLLTNLDIWHA